MLFILPLLQRRKTLPLTPMNTPNLRRMRFTTRGFNSEVLARTTNRIRTGIREKLRKLKTGHPGRGLVGQIEKRSMERPCLLKHGLIALYYVAIPWSHWCRPSVRRLPCCFVHGKAVLDLSEEANIALFRCALGWKLGAFIEIA